MMSNGQIKVYDSDFPSLSIFVFHGGVLHDMLIRFGSILKPAISIIAEVQRGFKRPVKI